MPVHAKNAGAWAVCTSVYAKHVGVWKRCAGVWARAAGVWQKLGGNLSSASAGNGLGECAFFPPATQCSATAHPTAYAIDGWPPFTYQWYVISSDSGMSFGSMTSQSCSVSGLVGHLGQKVALMYCVVTDASGASAATNQVTATLDGENGNL